MNDDERRLAALPLWGARKLPDDRDRGIDQDAYSFTAVFKLFLRSWPFIYTQIGGAWRERPLAHWSALGDTRGETGSYLWMPPLLTVLLTCGLLGGWMDPGADASRNVARFSGVAIGCQGALVFFAWLLLVTRDWKRVVVSALGAMVGLAALVLSFRATSGALPKLYCFALVAMFVAAWFVRLHARDSRLSLALRVRSHLVYYYALEQVRRGIALVIGAYIVVLLYQNLLQAEPLTPFLAGLLGLEHLSSDVVEELSFAQRHELKWFYVYLIVGLFFVNLPFRFFLPVYNVWILQQINQDLRLALVERWHRLSMRYHNDHRVGDSIYRVYQDSAQVTSVIGRLIAAFIQLWSLIACVALLSLLDPFIGLLCFCIGVPVIGWGHWFSPRLRMRALVARETNSDLTSRIQEIFAGVRVIKAYGTEEKEQAKFEEDSVVAFNAAYGARSLVALITIVSFTITAAFLLTAEFQMGLLGAASEEIFASGLALLFGIGFARWNVAAFNWGKSQLFDGATDVRQLAREWAVGQDMAMGLHRVFDILDIEPDVQDAADAVDVPGFEREVRFEDVTFGYAPGQRTLKNISFSAAPGSITAIVGPTGAGKSTLVTLLLRLFDPDEGRISIDGADIKTLRVESLRENVSIALQENILFAMTVADNIRYVVPQASDEEVREAARIACADDFIEALPEGYDTLLGDKGGKLSTGQRQRLSIARALIKDTPILVLDEPTAALDAETEHRVMNHLAEWGRGRAIFVITHRFSTIRQADQILFLQDGELRERGDHDALMRVEGGRYRGLVEVEEQLATGTGGGGD
ncbi:MAG: ABC transporter ATP-binding protein [Pseudomonadales bacterium]